MRSIFTLVLATIALSAFSQTTIKVVNNGSSGPVSGWLLPSNWDLNRIPLSGDIVEIPEGKTITLKGQAYPSAVDLTVRIYGTLDFEPSGKLDLTSAGTIQIFSGGSITSDNNNSEVITINSVVKYRGGTDLSPLTGPAFASAATGASGTTATGFGFGVLPIKLKSFTALAKGAQISLKWSTEEEINTRSFIIERSTNARTWTPIQTVAAKGEAADYAAIDVTLAPGDNFYRLQSVDMDGKTEYSNVVKVARGRSLAAFVSPNPASGQVTVSLSTAATEPLHLQLVSSNGQVVKQARYASGTTLIQFGVKGSTSGVYTLLLRNGNTTVEATQLLIK
jgi:hypothetical protein